mmetsp:Transcript_9170/g.21117  ORF Transcript_9170/g.21117 Transcript_9170/m.21117 type:complete len:392 (+) Transcript_9170:76-1251(+)
MKMPSRNKRMCRMFLFIRTIMGAFLMSSMQRTVHAFAPRNVFPLVNQVLRLPAPSSSSPSSSLPPSLWSSVPFLRQRALLIKRQMSKREQQQQQQQGGISRREFLEWIQKIPKWILQIPILLLLAGEVYSRSEEPFVDSSKIQFDYPTNNNDVQHLTILFHGAGGPDENVKALMTALEKRNTNHHHVVLVDWSVYSKDLLKASFTGQAIGRFVAKTILSSVKKKKSTTPLETLHVVGISVGAFGADATLTYLRQHWSSSSNDNQRQSSPPPIPRLQETLLDPFCLRGVLDGRYGQRQYGKAADYAQDFYNTDDPVVSTNDALPHCICTNVTPIRPPEIFGHDWPLVYVSKHVEVLDYVPLEKQLPRGTITVLHNDDEMKQSKQQPSETISR